MDLRAYHDSCSLMAGLVEINKSLNNRKLSKNEIMAEVDALKAVSDQVSKINDLSNDQKDAIRQIYVNEIKNKMQAVRPE